MRNTIDEFIVISDIRIITTILILETFNNLPMSIQIFVASNSIFEETKSHIHQLDRRQQNH